ncbi:MFS transporter [Streptomyces sp. WAC05292]|uniref:MFS transporter n=1 Tax=Streptomyces sp. WAC05292 TaxID=2487418 RepID=UPI000F735CE4|nr:MFS transporter [Streptomyces sp. WAC05292]RSS84876.1 MFS transporter [Streptomyces sp. WAC05292]
MAPASETPLPQDPAPPLRRNRNFTVFWLGQALSVLGGSITYLALPLLVLDATGSIVRMGLLTVVMGATGILTGLFAGYVVDRTDRRRLMVACDLGRAVLLGAVPFVWLAGPRLWVLYVLTAVVTVLKTLFDVAYVTSVPALVRREDLAAANARLMGTFAVGTLFGPVAAGLVTAGVGAAWALAVDGATFLVSAISLRWVAFGPAPERTGPAEGGTVGGGTGREGVRGRLREVFTTGFTFLWGHRLLRPLTVLLTLLTFLTMGATDLLVFRLREDLGRDAAVVGLVVAVSGLGVVAASACAARLRRAFGFGPCWLGAVVLIGAAVAVTGTSTGLPVIAAAAAVFMFGMTLGGVSSMTLRQEVTPEPLLGRVTSAFWTVHNAAGPIGAAVLTLCAGRWGVTPVSLAGGVFCLLIAAAGLLTPLRSARSGGPSAPPAAAGAGPGAAGAAGADTGGVGGAKQA